MLNNRVFVLISIFLRCSLAGCPDGLGWTEAGDSCYLVSLHAMDWFTAQEYCWSQGAYLAEVKSQEEEDILDQFLVHGLAYWIGLNDIETEG